LKIGMPRHKEKPPKSKKEFKTFVHRDDFDNQELVSYLKKKGLSFGSLKSLVEQALDKGTGKSPKKKDTEKRRHRRKGTFPPIEDARDRKKTKKKRKDAKGGKRKSKKDKEREQKQREKDADTEFMNAIETILPKEKREKVASYFTKGKTAMLAKSQAMEAKAKKQAKAVLEPLEKPAEKRIETPPTHDTTGGIENASPEKAKVSTEQNMFEVPEFDLLKGDPTKPRKMEADLRPSSRQNEPFKITLAHPVPKESSDQKESDSIVQYRLEMEVVPWLRADENGLGADSVVEELLKDASYFTLTTMPRTTCQLTLACPLPCDDITDFRTGQHVVHIDHENMHDYSIPEPKRIEVDATRWKELFQDNREPPCPAPATTAINRTFVPQEHSANPDQWALTKLKDLKNNQIPQAKTISLDKSDMNLLGRSEENEKQDESVNKQSESKSEAGKTLEATQTKESSKEEAREGVELKSVNSASNEKQEEVKQVSAKETSASSSAQIPQQTASRGEVDVNSLTMQVVQELRSQNILGKADAGSEEMNQIADVIANIVKKKLNQQTQQSTQAPERRPPPQRQENNDKAPKINIVPPEGTRPTLYGQKVIQGARVPQTTVGTAIMETKLSGLRQNVGGTVPITASVDPYNAAAALSTMNGTDEFGGPTAVTVSRPPTQVQREPAQLPRNAYPPPSIPHPSEMSGPGGWPEPPSGMNIGAPQMGASPYMQNQMSNPMMNPMMQQMMMQQMMMMQQQGMMNPMMQPNMSGDGRSGLTPPLQVPSRRSGRQSAIRSQRSVRSSNPPSGRGVSKASVKDLFSKALNGRHRQVEELFARGVPPDTVDEHGNSVLLVAAQNGTKKLIKTALRYGADINAQNKAGQTALHYCFAFKYEELAAYLISKGADDTLQNSFGYTCYDGLRPPNA